PEPHTSGRSANVRCTVPSGALATRWASGAPRAARSACAAADVATAQVTAMPAIVRQARVIMAASLVDDVFEQLQRARVLRAREPEHSLAAQLLVLLVAADVEQL